MKLNNLQCCKILNWKKNHIFIMKRLKCISILRRINGIRSTLCRNIRVYTNSGLIMS